MSNGDLTNQKSSQYNSFRRKTAIIIVCGLVGIVVYFVVMRPDSVVSTKTDSDNTNSLQVEHRRFSSGNRPSSPPVLILNSTMASKLTNAIIQQYEAQRLDSNISNLTQRLDAGEANAIEGLLQLGEAGVIPLSRGLTNSNSSIRASTLNMLGFLAGKSLTNAEIVLPAMVALINDPELRVRVSAMQSLGNFTNQFNLLEPYLRQLMAVTNYGPEIQEAATESWQKLKLSVAVSTAGNESGK